MDCCNYMQYRHHQPYYGSPYYNPVPTYHGEYYGQQIYQEYYGSSHYYPQQWQCSAPFPDYVYNPKEARIRKAMREATRERSIGTSPMVQRANPRRTPSHGWLSPQTDLLMPPLGELDAPICSYPAGSGHYMDSLNTYNKSEPQLMPSATSSLHPNYMQSNPLAQLQHQTEMWSDYRSAELNMTGGGFMMGEVGNYPAQSTEMGAPPPIMMDKEPTSAPDKILDQQAFAFEQANDGKIKKPESLHGEPSSAMNKPLPDFNEAFGSTERGRFQRLAPNLDYFFDNAPVKFEDYQI